MALVRTTAVATQSQMYALPERCQDSEAGKSIDAPCDHPWIDARADGRIPAFLDERRRVWTIYAA